MTNLSFTKKYLRPSYYTELNLYQDSGKIMSYSSIGFCYIYRYNNKNCIQQVLLCDKNSGKHFDLGLNESTRNELLNVTSAEHGVIVRLEYQKRQ